MKKMLLFLVSMLVVGYLIFSASYFKNRSKDLVCNGLEIVVSNADLNQFIDTAQVAAKIKSDKLDPSGKLINEVNTIEIEEAILQNPHVKKAEVFITNKNNIRVVLEERKPIIRIIPNNGKSYYIDEEAEAMPISNRYTVYLPVATGSIKESFAKEDLYKFALFLQKSKFWNAQIEHIVVYPNNDVAFIPRVGDQTIIIGSLEGAEEKLDKLLNFYKNGLNRIGWNKYSTINLKYDKQVVCTRK